MKHLVFVDGHAQVFRAIFAPIPTPLTAPDGTPTSGVYVFLRWLSQAIGKLAPDYFAIAVDTPRHLLERRRMFAAYKAKRPQANEDVVTQAKLILRLCRKLELPMIAADGWEADDVLATLASRYAREDRQCTIVGRDKDLHQILKPGIELYDPQTGEFFLFSDVKKRWGVSPKQVIDVQCLAGDTADGIPGAKGIGLKTAVTLIKTYGNVREVIRNRKSLTPGLQKSLKSFDVAQSKALVTLRTDLDLSCKLKQLRWRGLDFGKIKSDLRSLGIRRLDL